MAPDVNPQQVAHRILQILPPLMRVVAAEVRSTKHVEPAHFGILMKLLQRPCSLGELAERQEVSLPTMSKSVSTLAERGWVTRLPSRFDRRVMIVELTPLGVQILADAQGRTQACVAEMLTGLSQDELDKVAAGLEILESALPSVEPVAS